MSSNGGLIYPAIEIGKIIKIMGYTTVVTDKDVCASACALIWMAGSNRVASYDGNVGFHASYRNDSGKLVEVGAANALIGNYLTLLGESAKTVVFATAAPPDRILWLTAANKDAAGIDFHNFTPSQRQASSSAKTPPPVRTVVPPRLRVPTVKSSPSVPRVANVGGHSPEPDVIMWEDIPPINPATKEPFVVPPKWKWKENSPNTPWVLMLNDKNYDGLYYINQETFSKYLIGGWEFWMKIIHKNEKIGYSYSKILFQLNCKSKLYRSKYVLNFDKNSRIVNSKFDDSIYSNKFDPIIPDSIADGLHKSVCK